MFIDENRLKSSPQEQRGFLCDLGNQIPIIEVCDGKSDCQYGEDENEESCSLKDTHCESNATNTCSKSWASQSHNRLNFEK